jgi:hypothetical protein
MGRSIDPRSAPRTSGRRSRRHRPSADPRTTPAVVSQRIDAHHRKAHGGQTPRPEGRSAPEGGACLEETPRGIGWPGSA